MTFLFLYFLTFIPVAEFGISVSLGHESFGRAGGLGCGGLGSLIVVDLEAWTT